MPKFMLYTTWKGTSRYEVEADSEQHAMDKFWAGDYDGNLNEELQDTSMYNDEDITHVEELREFDDAKD